MDINEILSESDISKKIEMLKAGRTTDQPDVDTYKKQWDIKEHDIYNTAKYQDKKVKTDDGERLEPVNRVPVSMQKLIVKRAASFLFGNDVKMIADDSGAEMIKAISNVLADNKTKYLNRKVARVMFSSTEVAEYWYAVKSDIHDKYGFKSEVKLRMTIFDPMKGDVLYPFFDDYGDMIAFSRQFKKKKDGKEINYFETWTDTKYVRWKSEGSQWIEDTPADIVHNLGKIPIIYGAQEQVEWYDAQVIIERLEKLTSKIGNTNDYHSSPKIFVQGDIKGWASKGDDGAIIEGDQGSEAKYLAWEQSPEAVRLEIDTLLRFIYSTTQTPDISFEGVKGLGSATSGESLKMLFFDAHLKVEDKMEIFGEYLQRRINLLKAFLLKINGSLPDVDIEPDVTPYMVNDEKNSIDNIVTSVQGGVLSKKTGVSLNQLVGDADKEYEQVKAEAKEQQESSAALDANFN